MCVQHGPHLKVAHLEAEAALHPSRVRPGLQHGPIVAGHPGPPLELGRVRRRLLEAAEIEPAEVGRRGGGGERGGPRSSHWRGSLLLGGGFPGPPDLPGLVVGLLDLHGVRPAALRSGQRHQGVVDVTGRRVLPLGTGLEGVPAPLAHSLFYSEDQGWRKHQLHSPWFPLKRWQTMTRALQPPRS